MSGGGTLVRNVALRVSDASLTAMIHLLASYHDQRGRDAFGDVERYCMFIGYPRSGHSLVGALIDAHPHALVGHEQDALRYVEAGYSRSRLFNLLLANTQVFAAVGRRWRGGFSYHVPHQWQGRFERIRVIGDKKGGQSTRRLAANPGLLDALRSTVGVDLALIHVVRNPFDNITTLSLKHGRDLSDSIRFYFSLCETVARVKDRSDTRSVLELRHEDIVRAPEATLIELCGFLGLSAPEAYVRDCAALLHEAPHRSRHRLAWRPELIDQVAREIERYPFLEGYAYDR